MESKPGFIDVDGVWLNPDFKNRNLEEFLPGIEVPTLVLQGADDQYGTDVQIKAIEAGLSCQTETVMIAGAKHSPHLEQQETTIKTITAFFEKHLDL